jgi:hypothetical protein
LLLFRHPTQKSKHSIFARRLNCRAIYFLLPKTNTDAKGQAMSYHRRMTTYLSALFAIVLPSLAHATDDRCLDIQRRLNGGALTIGNSAETRSITRAINDQNGLLRQIRIEMRKNGCSIGSVIVYGNRNAELCGELGDQMVEARAELDYLNAERRNLQLTRQSDIPDDERRSLENAWEEYGCRRTESLPASQLPAPEPQIVGRDLSPLDPPVTIIKPGMNHGVVPQPKRGSLRTVCVRLCDGKFFPISASATPLDFLTQSKQCQQACPATETELFYHSLIDQETRDMISAVTGKPYADLPSAFEFQSMGKSTNESCTCGLNAGIQFKDNVEDDAAAKPPAEKIEAGSSPAQQNASNKPIVDEGRPYVPGERKVRSVGPQFFPQDNEMDLSNPAAKGAQPQQ